MFVPSDAGCTVLGLYSDSQKPGLVSKNAGSWRSVYSGVPLLPAEVLRKLFAEAGVHIYCDSGDNLMVNAAWLSIHTAIAGRKQIQLQNRSPVFDIISNKLLSAGTQAFDVELPAGATRIYLLANAPRD